MSSHDRGAELARVESLRARASDDGETLASLARGRDRRLRLVWRSYEGRRYFALLDEDRRGERWWSRSMTTIRAGEARAIVDALEKALAEGEQVAP